MLEKNNIKNLDADCGVTLAFLAVFIPVLLLLLAFVLETAQLFYTTARLQTIADATSLAAIERYYSATECEEDDDEDSCRTDAARARASEIAGKNVVYSTEVDLQLGGQGSQELVLSLGRYVPCRGVEYTPGAPEAELCDRYTGDDEIYVEIDDFRSLAPGALPTAARISGNLHPYSGFMLKLLSQAGILKPYSDSVATTLPRVIQVLIDVSASKTGDSHRLTPDPDDSTGGFAPLCGLGFRMAYPLNISDSAVADASKAQDGSLPPPASSFPTYLRDMWQYTVDGGNEASAPSPDPRSCDAVTRPRDYLHYIDHYRGLTTLGDFHYDEYRAWYLNEYPGYEFPHPVVEDPIDGIATTADTTTGDYYYYDSYRDGSTRPEPLSTIFDGVQSLVNTFINRRVAGDAIGITALRGAHSNLSWSSTIRPTSNFQYLNDILSDEPLDQEGGLPANIIFAGESWLPADVSASDLFTGTQFTKAPLAARLGFFPGRFPHTDAYAPLLDTVNHFSTLRQGGRPATYSVIIISDGLFNCPYCLEIQNPPPWEPDSPCQQMCNNTYESWGYSTLETAELAWDAYARQGVNINAIAVSGDIAPHTLAMRNSSDSRCYTDTTFRKDFEAAILSGDMSFVSGDQNPVVSFYAMTIEGGGVFRSANVPLYAMTAITGGVFAPLRPEPSSCIGSGSSCAYTPAPLNVSPPGTPGYKPLRDYSAIEIAAARIDVDPECRTQSEQIEEVMERILAQNPYVNIKVDN